MNSFGCSIDGGGGLDFTINGEEGLVSKTGKRRPGQGLIQDLRGGEAKAWVT